MATSKKVPFPQPEYIPSPTRQTDILRPTIFKVGSRQFRKITGRSDPLPNSKRGQESSFSLEEEDEMIEDEPCCSIEDQEELQNVRKLRSGEYELLLPIPSQFYKYIIGKGGQTRRNIERDTQCKIIIPRQGQPDGEPVVVIGSTKRSLVSVKQRLEVIVWSNRGKEGITHFLGLPLNKSPIIERFEEFKSNVLTEIKEVDEELFQKPIKLHITLPVFYLFSEEEERKAIDEIRKVLPLAISKLPSSPSLIMKGLEAMNDDPSKVHVLYGKVELSDGSGKLQEFADCLQKELSTSLSDYIQNSKGGRIKLHATVMNSSFKDYHDSSESHLGTAERRGKWYRESFDGSEIIKNYKDYEFGSISLNELCLLKRGEKDSNGFYKTIETFDIIHVS